MKKSGLSGRVNRKLRKRKGKISQAAFDLLSRTLIVFLCLYISGRCINVILGDEMKKEIIKKGKKIGKNVIEVVIDKKSDVMELFENEPEEKLTAVEKVKKKMTETGVEEYFEEITTENQDKDREKEISNLVEQAKQENEAVLLSTSHDSGKEGESGAEEEKESGTAEETAEEKVEEAFAGKTIVALPKLTGTKYTAANIKSFSNAIKKFYTVTSATSIKESDLNIDKALKMKFEIEGNSDKPQILIYHTHSQEKFSDSKAGDSQSIVAVGEYLATILREQFGYNVLHDKSTYDIVNGKLDRNKAYDQSRAGVSKILKDNPTINLILDIHRDGVSDNTRLVTTVNGKKTAKIMFFNGMSRFKDSGDIDYLYNPYLKENLALSFQMKLNAEAYYPGFTRRNYIQAYQYNLDLCEKSMLIEMGAQTNTYEEVKNAAEPLAMLIHLTMGK